MGGMGSARGELGTPYAMMEPSVRRVICGVERGSNYKEPAVAVQRTKRGDCRRMNTQELAGR